VTNDVDERAVAETFEDGDGALQRLEIVFVIECQRLLIRISVGRVPSHIVPSIAPAPSLPSAAWSTTADSSAKSGSRSRSGTKVMIRVPVPQRPYRLYGVWKEVTLKGSEVGSFDEREKSTCLQ
jgi:hypothetical protein